MVQKVERLAPPHVPLGLWLGRSVKDAELKALGGLTQLRALSFEGNFAHGVTDVGMKEIAELTELQALNLEHTGHTDAGMKELAGLTQLHSLDISWNDQVSDKGLKTLAGLNQLRTLRLERTAATDAGLREVAGLKQLEFLCLPGQVSSSSHHDPLLVLNDARRNVSPRSDEVTSCQSLSFPLC